MPDPVRVPAYAKLNLMLDILGRREDGYHDLATLFHSIDLHDDVEVALATDLNLRGPENFECRISLHCDQAELPADATNLAWRAAERFVADHFRERNRNLYIDLRLVKRIPVGGGLAGGSADAAATILALDRLLGLALPADDLLATARTLGADVPFCLARGTAIGTGIGDQLEFVDDFPPLRFILAVPDFAVDTKWAYGSLKLSALSRHPDPHALIALFKAGQLEPAAAEMYNAFEHVVLPRHPRIGEIKAEFARLGCPAALMSGSGSSVFAIVPAGVEPAAVCGDFRLDGVRLVRTASLGAGPA